MVFDPTRCDFCGECLEHCQHSHHSLEEASEAIRSLVENRDCRILDECVTCWACNSYCPTGCDPIHLLLERMEVRGYECSQALKTVVDKFDSPLLAPSEVIQGNTDRPVISVCTYRERIPGLFEGQLFDGATLLVGGDFETMLVREHVAQVTRFRQDLHQKICNIANAAGNRPVVFMHDDCYASVTTKARDYGIPVRFKPVHQAEYFLEYLREHRGQIKHLNKKVAYHLPCAVHYTPWIDEWIDEVLTLLGCERVARVYDRKNQICCGGIIGPRQGEAANLRVRQENIRDAQSQGAQLFVVHCFPCAISLRQMAYDAGMQPYMLTELVRMGLGETIKGRGAGLGDNREAIKIFEEVISGRLRELPLPG